MLIDEGQDWSAYHGSVGRDKRIKALESKLTYIACDETLVCVHARCRPCLSELVIALLLLIFIKCSF